MKLDNKGFAISVILYSISAVVVSVLLLILAVNASNIKNSSNMAEEVKKNISGLKNPSSSDVNAPIIEGGSTNWKNSAVTIKVKTAPTTTDGISYYEYYKSTENKEPTSSTTISGTTSNELKVNNNGIWYIWYRAVSNSGARSGWSNSQTVKLDTSTPGIPTVSGGSTTWKSNKTFTLNVANVTSGIQKYEYYISSTTTTPDSTVEVDGSSTSTSIKIEKTGKYIYFRAVNNAGTKGSWTSYQNLFVDATEPKPVFTRKEIDGNSVYLQHSSVTAASGISKYNCYYGTTNTNVTTVSDNHHVNNSGGECIIPITAAYAKICATTNAGSTGCSDIKTLAKYFILNGKMEVSFNNSISNSGSSSASISGGNSIASLVLIGQEKIGVKTANTYDFSAYQFAYIEMGYNIPETEEVGFGNEIGVWIGDNYVAGTQIDGNHMPLQTYNHSVNLSSTASHLYIGKTQTAFYARYYISIRNLWFQLRE